MTLRINPVAKELEVPGIRVFSNRVAQYPDGVNLTIGQPDFPTPENVKRAGSNAIKDGNIGYSHNAGLLPLRESISRFFDETYQFKYSADDEIVVTNGASEGLDSVLRTILEPGDEVILPSPSYSGYESLIKLNGGVPVHLDISETDFKITPANLGNAITDRTKAIILNYPSNPTGVSLTFEEAERLVDVLKNAELYIISDEIYSENTFAGAHVSFGSFGEIREKLFIVHGLSKSHAMTGWRIGYVMGPAKLMQYVLRVHLNNSICASLPSQYAAIEALDNTREFPHQMNRTYMERRDFIYGKLNEMGLACEMPTGAFYIFPSVAETGLDDMTFATRLLEEAHVAVVPGSTFSKEGKNHIRISYASSMEQLEEGMKRIKHFIERL